VSLDFILLLRDRYFVINVKKDITARLVQPDYCVLKAHSVILTDFTMLASVNDVQKEAIVNKEINIFAQLENLVITVGNLVKHAPLAFPVKMEKK
jgi:hypothetical protein